MVMKLSKCSSALYRFGGEVPRMKTLCCLLVVDDAEVRVSSLW